MTLIYLFVRYAKLYYLTRNIFKHTTYLFILQIAKTFRDKHIPCDAIWMDIDFMDGFRLFTFDQVHYLGLTIVYIQLYHILQLISFLFFLGEFP